MGKINKHQHQISTLDPALNPQRTSWNSWCCRHRAEFVAAEGSSLELVELPSKGRGAVANEKCF